MDPKMGMLGRVFSSLKSLSHGRMVALALSGGLLLSGFLVLMLWSRGEDYQVLFSNLSPEDASSIVTRLKEGKIPYRISGGGGIVEVPSHLLHETRLELASQGLPRGGGIGFELFDQPKIGTTEFVQRIHYRRALQGELARTISQLQEVETARVHLVVPRRSPFLSEQEKARASVMVRLRPGAHLSKRQVKGIVHLVASSVESLDPSEVTVVDARGEILSGPSGQEEGALLSSSQHEYRQAIEKDIEKRIESMLEAVLGPGKAIVRASAVIDFRRVEKTEERFDADNPAVRSEQRSEEIAQGGTLRAAGVPGVLSNSPGSERTAASGEASETSRRKNETVNYEISRITSRVVEPTGVIKRLTAAVLLDGTYEKKADPSGKESTVYKPRSPEEMKKYEEIVKSAMGFNPERGDRVEVQNIPFEKVESDEKEVASAGGSLIKGYLPLVRQIATGILLLVFLLFVVRPFLRGMRAAYPGGSLPTLAMGTEQELPGAPPQKALEAPKGREMELIEMAKKEPERVAKAMKNWLGPS